MVVDPVKQRKAKQSKGKENKRKRIMTKNPCCFGTEAQWILPTKSCLCLASFLRPLLLRWLIRCQGHPAVQGSEPQRRMFSLALLTSESACCKPASVLRSSSIVSLTLRQLSSSEYRSSQAFDCREQQNSSNVRVLETAELGRADDAALSDWFA